MQCDSLPLDGVLCYVTGDGYLACYFTTRPLQSQWGEGWDIAPYWCNAGKPYRPQREDDHWQIVTVIVRGPERTWTDYHSLKDINAGAVAWLEDWQEHVVWAGTTLAEFIGRAREYGWEPYFPVSAEKPNEGESV